MSRACLKCGKDLAGKRRGTKFCEVSCRTGQWQKSKRASLNQGQPVRMDDEHLWTLLEEGQRIIADLQGHCNNPFGDDEADKAKLATWCRVMGYHPILKTRQERAQEQERKIGVNDSRKKVDLA